jgi:hypothetical protein
VNVYPNWTARDWSGGPYNHARLLEALGVQTFRVVVIEFVASEHTPRNLLIAGVRRATPDATARTRAREEIRLLKTYFGIGRQALDDLLSE